MHLRRRGRLKMLQATTNDLMQNANQTFIFRVEETQSYCLPSTLSSYCPLLYCILIPFPPFPQGIHTEYIKNHKLLITTLPGLLTL
jgi:hypothetical protein